MMSTLHIAAVTHHGKIRSANEDTVVVASWLRRAPMSEPQSTRLPLSPPVVLAVCDGMGGHEAGEVASELAASQLGMLLTGKPDPARAASAVSALNKEVYAASRSDPARRRMGSTIAGLWMDADQVVWFNVGDSSVFRRANDFMMKLSIDDVPEGAKTGMLTQSLGGSDYLAEIVPHVGEDTLRVGVTYLLCSDGLTDLVSFDNIEAAIAYEPETAASQLLEAALAAGGHDNISIIAARVLPPEATGGEGM
jgi:serine/threonine protein phosphatase PrpC